MARLLSVNVGLPRNISWNDRTVYTGIFKNPVAGRCRVGRLNLDGDGQGDLAGHGGEQRAVFVYQIASYRYWQKHLNRTDFVYGQFGENFTVEGLPDDAVCIGDRFRIGGALFEVTQPRVTCYRVGIRMDEPRMPALLTSSGRPGFYFRVLQEGEVGAGDEILKVGEANERVTVAELNALLYSPEHPRVELERAARIKALSPGWRGSFEALLRSQSTGVESGNAGLAPPAALHPAAPGFQPLAVADLEQESVDVVSLSMRHPDGKPLPPALPGQYIVLRLRPTRSSAALFRSYSLSGPLSEERYRISVKIEPHGTAGLFLRDHVRIGDLVDVSSPRGSFTLQPGQSPVVLLSAGIGATPLLAILYALAAARDTRQVLWLYAARDRRHHPFAAEVRRLMASLPHGRSYVCYSRPDPVDRLGVDFDATGHLSSLVFNSVSIPQDADVYLCGPVDFMADMKEALAASGVAPDRVRIEIFNGSEPLNPGVVASERRAPHLPEGDTDAGPLVSFARSGVAAHWNPSVYRSILELAEACDVPSRWSCRTGVCHNCESGLISGAIAYEPEPLERPADGNLLICCSQPTRDLVIDL
ncbi:MULTISPECIES: MOSC and FAD-binding oxidoreductase domain-containing protein [unclassified Mesorhizobium]|uniref:MOSC and FAD-binding oxidoreductase domain-containing protein n=1 Tax=unclassified Mesorhizobium TaxID=325217 RepID=UPI00112B2E66|nr:MULTISPECIES: MOSC and FAD-binding oxidoreductase domain-containing protein [unclassified Mesorhizobium]TPJ41635.1 MOSC domain-containing protein [Mesorhizobium sp. B2-6-6]MBZ9983378.1 MOSC domain-containing protein [Mesorhizobium sp. BR-1-1-8]MCA0000347.1 MOSC domain-containing protein [Mesorhizobium sp. B264B2A]MCA0006399.1 MOSC domain-containing protein [Mesorhizobium sp. B264B1B]MCA0020442.1 MOSC domain-containing protein [Mesorhizobium sp. B264B1A]